MGRTLYHAFVGWLDVGDPTTRAGADLLSQRFRSLQKQIPRLYLSVLACFVGLQFATSGALIKGASPIIFVIVLVIFRLFYWYRRQHRETSPNNIIKYLVETFFFAVFFSVTFCLWCFYILKQNAEDANFLLLFGSLASVGCAYGLSSFSKAARIPLFVLGLPISIGAMLAGQPGYVGLGVAMFLIILLVSKALATHDQELTQLSLSRSAIEDERERAVAAESAAIEERSKATRIALLDPLTGLPNRRSLMDSLETMLAAGVNGQPAGALAIVDLDGFKPINDAFGHGAGDAVLSTVGTRLSQGLTGSQECARLGGDEFAVLLPDCMSEERAHTAGENVLSVLSGPIVVDDREFTISGCCGMTLLKFGENVSDALVKADIALYDCKHRGKSAVGVFSSEMEISRLRRLNIEDKLRDPVARSLISLVFQPIFQLQSGALSSFEALARWHLPDVGEVEPSEFIIAAEQIGVIKSISGDLFKRAVAEALTWPSWVALSFNLSGPQLCAPELAEDVLHELDSSGLDPRRVEIEVTETLLLANFDAARRNLAQLRARGVRVVVDDFGAGYASISYLQEMQFDGVKIDGSLVRSATNSLHSFRLLKGVIELCASLAVPCVAEHIETEEQYNLLRELGCARGQGHLLGRAGGSTFARDLANSSSSVLDLDSALTHGKNVYPASNCAVTGDDGYEPELRRIP